jgi:glycosyltransferase involved in cell wall biosynthesis
MKYKILHLIPTLGSGGAERQLVNLVSSTSRETVNHVVCTIGEPVFFAPDIRENGYKVIELKIFNKHPFFQTASKFRRIIREEKPDIIQSWLYDANISARLAVSFLGKVPIITSLQLADYEPEAARIGNWNPHKVRGLKMIDKLTSLMTKPYFVPCSEFVKKSYQQYFGMDERRTQVIYNSVNAVSLSAPANAAENLRQEFALPANAFIYLNVGRLDPQKNHKVLLKAFQKVSEEIPNAFLLLAGVGFLDGELKKLAEDLQIKGKTLFLGRRNDIGALLELADAFVFPSFFEGLPVALVEAMFKALPCISSRIEVFKEVVTDGETGLLINPESVDELKDAMIKLYKDEDLRNSLGANAFEQAQTKFNAAVTARQWEDFYSKVKSAS